MSGAVCVFFQQALQRESQVRAESGPCRLISNPPHPRAPRPFISAHNVAGKKGLRSSELVIDSPDLQEDENLKIEAKHGGWGSSRMRLFR